MSVIVKGMEIPENCWECVKTDLNIAISVFGGMCPFCEKIRTDHDMQTGRHPDCPLGALPEKHVRLGDLDAVEKRIDRFFARECKRLGFESYEKADREAKLYLDGIINALGVVIDTPAIIEAEDNNE